MADSSELEIAEQDTVQIFYQFYLKHQNSATDQHDPSSAAEGAVLEQCPQTSSASESTSKEPTPVRSKSPEASRKEKHLKAMYGVKVVSSRHCKKPTAVEGAEAATTRQGEHKVAPSPSVEVQKPVLQQNGSNSPKSSSPNSTGKLRPETLFAPNSGSRLKRMPSGASDSSGKTTPAQDPPMDSDLISPVPMSEELASSYPPMSGSQQNSAREGLFRSAVHTQSQAAPSCQVSCKEYGLGRHQRAPPPADERPRTVKAKMIAERLKLIGDNLEDEICKSKVDQLTEVITSAIQTSNPQLLLSYIYNDTQSLSWRKIAELFKLLCRVMGAPKYDDPCPPLFEKVWSCLLDEVVPWIRDNGGWSACLRATDSVRPANTPSAVRRQLEPAISEPTLPQHGLKSSCSGTSNGRTTTAGNRGLVSGAGGRMAFTPQMPRHSNREQSSPCLVRSYTLPHSVAAEHRGRIWSLTESGSFKRADDGVEDIERSISEFDMTDEESDTFTTSPEEEEDTYAEEDEREEQVVNQTLTSASPRSGMSSHSSSSSFHNSSSPPITVPSPHSNSQPETVSAFEFPCDSGVEVLSLSLSCSPPRATFSVGGGDNSRHSPMTHARNQTSLTSLSSIASASPVHTSPMSRKNSSSNMAGGVSYFTISKPRQRSSGGSLKESRSKQSGESASSSRCSRTGSLTRSPRSNNYRTSHQSAGSGNSGHASWMESPPVRRMSTSAAVVYELIYKSFFDSS